MNNDQEKAIKKINGPCIILAGAGTGKSYTIKKKANYLVNELKKYKPEDILCLTFSNEATNSLKIGMREELKTTTNVTVKTFHGFCSDIIKEHGNLIDIDSNFEILLADDAKIMIHKYLNVLPYWANRFINTIMTAKDFGISLDDIKKHLNEIKKTFEIENLDEYEKKAKLFLQTFYLLNKEEQKEQKEQKKEYSDFISKYSEYKKFLEFVSVWDKYNKLKKEKNLLDFSDLNELALKIFNEFNIKTDFKYVFVDEFQDTNKLQFKLLEFIADHKNITVVGDRNQSIYGFRGSYKESFDNFKKSFDADNSCIFKLDKSRRSKNTVLNISYDLIKNNYEDEKECVFVEHFENISGNKVKVIALKNQYEEARVIGDLVEEKIKNKIPLNKICILHRTHKQAKVIKEILDLKKIPSISAGKTNLMQKPEIKTTIAYLSMINNTLNRTATGEQAWWYIFHYHNTISLKDSIKIGRFLKKNNYNLQIYEQESIDKLLLTSIEKLDLTSDTKKIVSKIVNNLQKLSQNTNKPLPELILDIYEITGLNRAFSYDRSIENIEKMLNLKKFYEISEKFYLMHEKDISKFIDYLEIIDNLDVNIDASKIEHVDAVRLMTIHSCKGLEFDTVILSNLAKDRFPISRTGNEPLIPKHLLLDIKNKIVKWKQEGLNETEIAKKIKKYEKEFLLLEERRLCYVAFTRAENQLILTYAKDYKGEEDSTTNSLFLDEINFKENENIEFIEDNQELCMYFSHQSIQDIELSKLKNQIINSLDTDSVEDINNRIKKYIELKNNINELSRNIKFNFENTSFSPSAISLYLDCPKKYELSKIYSMPQRNDFDETGGGSTIGSFIHKVLEIGVNKKLSSLDEYLKLAKELNVGEFKYVNLNDAQVLLEVFWHRNKDKIQDSSETEVKINFNIDNFKFNGVIDRIDYLEDGIEIIDYKTNKNQISPDKRALQLGFYAIALKEKGYNVKRLTLDMLRLDKPIVMDVIDNEVKAKIGGNSKSNFNLNELKKELIEYCNNIVHDYENGFNVTDDENNCKFCGYKFYCPKFNE
ncbi:MAG: ATP-dependent helicase [Candidatus Woesearchaeota archaeon]